MNAPSTDQKLPGSPRQRRLLRRWAGGRRLIKIREVKELVGLGWIEWQGGNIPGGGGYVCGPVLSEIGRMIVERTSRQAAQPAADAPTPTQDPAR